MNERELTVNGYTYVDHDVLGWKVYEGDKYKHIRDCTEYEDELLDRLAKAEDLLQTAYDYGYDRIKVERYFAEIKERNE